MYNWFEVKAKFEKVTESGVQKKVTESYLVDAISHTEAETRAIEELKPYISGEFGIDTVRRVRYSETFLSDKGDRFYKVKVALITLDERSGSEKRTPVLMLAQANTVREAIDVLNDGMKGTMADYVITSVTELPTMDIFPYQASSK